MVAVALAMTLAACNGGKKDDKKEEVSVPVEAARASFGVIEAAYRGTATLEAEDEATVNAKTAGVIERVFAEEGDRVRAGQVLARLETERLRYELARSKSSLDQAEQNFKRNESVFQRNIVSREAYDKTKYDLETARAAYDVAALNLREADIRAPIDGVVSQRYIKAGNQITVGAQTFRVTRMDRLQASIYVPERDIHKLAPQQRATLVVDAWPGKTFGSAILRINPVVDAQSGTVKVTLAMDAGQAQLKPGMFGRVEILYDRREQALLVP
ncbi:MAG: efflux RND transporter periplasmic adaptor subunit, partial [Solimonas sp.]